MMRMAGRFSALAGRHRHVPGTDLVSATRGIPVADRRPASLRPRSPLRWPLGGGSRALAPLTVAVLALTGCSSALAASTARPPAPSYGFSVPTPSGPLTGANDQYLSLRLTASATAAAAQAPAWRACPYPGVPATLQCATLTVPIDYAHPVRGSTHVVIDRLPAADPAHRLGSLVVDPGGPGGSGTQLVAHEALGTPGFSSGVRDDYDLIGYDPRGVGLSDPIRCSAALFNRPIDYFPQTSSAFRGLVAHNRALGRSCERDSGPLAAHDDTISVARDLDAVRAALGEPTLNYLGLSYGTEIGSLYAALFPHRVGRMVLDGNLEHSLSERTMVLDESHAYEVELSRWGTWCDDDRSCSLRGDHPLQALTTLAARADRRPIPAPGCAKAGCRRRVTGQDIRQDAQDLILFKNPGVVGPGWAGLATAIRQAQHGNATLLSSPRATGDRDPAIASSGLTVECQDFPTTINTFAGVHALGTLVRRRYPLTGGLSQSYEIAAQCVGWPLAAHNPPHRLHVSSQIPPILMVNATYDPSTAYVWAKVLHRQLPHSVLLTRRGDGHTSYLNPGATRMAINAFLVNGTLPKPGTVLES
jgi:pimeloyl-ACP methyl ester carboxylesterase